MPVKRINPMESYSQTSTNDITDENMTDAEFRLYSYYRSCTPNHTMSAKDTAKKLKKSLVTIERLNKSLITKGFLLITGNSNPTYYIGVDMVEIATEENKIYLKKRKKRYEKISEHEKNNCNLPKDS